MQENVFLVIRNTFERSFLSKNAFRRPFPGNFYAMGVIKLFLYILVRGHLENSDSKNKGNFLELLELRSNDNEMIKKIKEELQFADHKIQNELIELMSKQVINHIVREIERAKYLSVMIDEITDISKFEQVSLIIRYTDDQFNVHELFMGFQRTTAMTGETLFNLLLE